MMHIKELEQLDTPFEFMYDQLCLYVANSLNHLPHRVRIELLDRDFFSVNPQYYLYYSFLFSNSNLIAIDKHVRLSVAGFLLYKSTLYKDEMLDNNNFEVDKSSLIKILQKEAVKILIDFYKEDSQFWTLWDKRKDEYYKGFEKDKNLKSIESIDEYVGLCDLKSSIGKVAIDCLYFESKISKRIIDEIYLSHNYFYVAFQILDDIADLEEDIDNHQFNIAFFELQKKCKQIKIKDLSSQNIKKYLYLTGCADELRMKALSFLNKAEAIAREHELKLWTSEIQRLYNTVLTHVLNTKGYIQFIGRTTPNLPIKSVKNPIQKALKYVRSKQNDDGSWNEIFNSSGLSDTWSTAFILYFLSQPKVKKKIDQGLIEKGVSFIINLDGRWGYNKYWISDFDSQNFALLTLYNNKKEISNHLDVIVNQQFISGGFTTYAQPKQVLSSLNNQEVNNVDAWCAEHECVSAVTFLLLCMTNTYKGAQEAIYRWLIQKKDSEGLIKSYWWTSGIYSSVFLIRGLLIQNSNWELIHQLCDAIFAKQNSNGSFGDNYLNYSPFYTGLVVDTICEDNMLLVKYRTQILSAVDWLKSSQLEDGSWYSSYAMRIPHPMNSNPDDLKDWPISTLGTNIRSFDYNRLFSTAVILSSLCKYDARD